MSSRSRAWCQANLQTVFDQLEVLNRAVRAAVGCGYYGRLTRLTAPLLTVTIDGWRMG